ISYLKICTHEKALILSSLLLSYLIFSSLLFCSQLSYSQCPHSIVVGSNVGIPNLSTATSWPLFLLTVTANNLANQNFCIDGTFTFDHTASSELTITNCDIVL